MAHDRKITKYDVRPIEEGGRLIGLSIQRTERWQRESDTGKLLSRGLTEDAGDALEIPISKVPDLVRDLADWPIWYATTNPEER